MDSPDLSVWLVSAYALIMLAAGWVVDVLGSRSARHSMSWRHSDFMYHDDVDGWRCHEDQWLWPTAFDPDKRVIRYEGAHAICGRCPSKDSCSPTPGPREITRPVDPWPYSDAGRFHRGVGLVITCVGVFIPMLLMMAFHATGDLIVLGTTTVVVIVAGVLPLARHLWNTPDNAPAHLPHVGSQEYLEAEEVRRSASAASTGPVPVTISSRPSGYRSVREAAEAIAAAQARAAATGRTVRVPFLADGAGKADSGAAAASAEPELRRVTALRTRKRVPVTGAELGSVDVGDGARGGARRSWSSVWNEATDTTSR